MKAVFAADHGFALGGDGDIFAQVRQHSPFTLDHGMIYIDISYRDHGMNIDHVTLCRPVVSQCCRFQDWTDYSPFAAVRAKSVRQSRLL